MNNASRTEKFETNRPNFVWTTAEMAKARNVVGVSWVQRAIAAMFAASKRAGVTIDGTVEFGYLSKAFAEEATGFIVKGPDAERMAKFLAYWTTKNIGQATARDTRDVRRHAVHAGAVFVKVG